MRCTMRLSSLALVLLTSACSESGKGASDAGSGEQTDASDTLDGTTSTPDAGGDQADTGSAKDDAGGPANDGGELSDAGSDAGDDAGMVVTCDPSVAPDVGKFALETVVSSIDHLVFAAQPPESSDFWLVQQTGSVLVHKAAGGADTKVLDVTSEITLSSQNDERGLLGLAFPPDFSSSGLFYVMITPTSGSGQNTDQVREYKLDGDSATLQDTLVTMPASAENHNGGTLLFGPDGLLYVGTGDGGGACNSSKPGAPQDPSALNGKILRLDPTRKDQMYAAEGNPFADNPLVLHYGLRNPFRISLDSATGDLFIGDVGQDSYEEVNFAKATDKGLNFGWAAYEGTQQTCPGRALRAGDTKVDPIFIADRRKNMCDSDYCDWISVIGGVVYRGSALPQLQGVYLFGDYKGVRMVALRQCEDQTSPLTLIRKNADPNAPNAPSFGADDFDALVAIIEDNQRELYFVVNRSSLRKVVPAP